MSTIFRHSVYEKKNMNPQYEVIGIMSIIKGWTITFMFRRVSDVNQEYNQKSTRFPIFSRIAALNIVFYMV